MDALKVIAQDSLKTGDEIPQIKIGDTVKVSVKIREGERERIKVRRSKLYYLRDRVGKAARVKSQVK